MPSSPGGRATKFLLSFQEEITQAAGWASNRKGKYFVKPKDWNKSRIKALAVKARKAAAK